MRILFPSSLASLFCTVLSAYSPAFHEAQTRMALGLIPKSMQAFLKQHEGELIQGARGDQARQVPTVEELEEQYRRVLKVSEDKRRPSLVARELGQLAHMVQLFMDPSASQGMSVVRERFQAYGDEHLSKLALTFESFWAVKAPLDPRPSLLTWSETKWERHRTLLEHIDPDTGVRKGPWDTLSIPYAQLQLSFSNGVHATANLWILSYRAAGAHWALPASDRP